MLGFPDAGYLKQIRSVQCYNTITTETKGAIYKMMVTQESWYVVPVRRTLCTVTDLQPPTSNHQPPSNIDALKIKAA
jgi:hypothetical protein